MAAFGVKDFTPPDWMAEEEAPGAFEVLPENWDAVHTFFACSTQWDQSRGIPYERLEIVMRRMHVEDADDVWWRVRVMEQAAVKEFAEQARSRAERAKRGV